jgi:hypothetical protein
MEKNDLREEYILQKIISEKRKRIYNGLNLLVIIVGSIIIFIFVTFPGFIIRKEVDLESLKRERVRLLLDVVKEKDLDVRIQSLLIIRSYYPQINNILDGIEVGMVKSGAQLYLKKRDSLNNVINSIVDIKQRKSLLLDARLLNIKIEEIQKSIKK